LTGEHLFKGLELVPEPRIKMGRHSAQVLCLLVNVLPQGDEPLLEGLHGLIVVPSLLVHMALKRGNSFLQIVFQLVNHPLLRLEPLIDLLECG
jgi:hypothetical protein